MNDSYVGQLTYLRVYSGRVESGAGRLQRHQGQARAHRPPAAHARQQERGRARGGHCGNIAAAVGLRVTTTGDTLCDLKAPVVLDVMEFPPPAMSVVIEPKTQAGQDELGGALEKLAAEDPSLPRVDRRRDRPDPDQRAWASCTWRSWSTAWCASSRSRPTSAARRWPTARASPAPPAEEETFVHDAAGRGQFAQVTVQLEPLRDACSRRQVRCRPARAILFENAPGGRHPAQGVRRRGRAGRPRGPGPRAAGQLPGDRREGDAGARPPCTRSIPTRSRSRSPVRRRPPAALREAGPVAARAGDGARGGLARGVHGRHRRQPRVASGSHPGTRGSRGRSGHRRRGSAGARCSGIPPTFVP